MRNNSIHGYCAAYCFTMSSVPSVEPSLTMTHFSGSTVCEVTDFSVSSMNCASFRAGVITTYSRLFDMTALDAGPVAGPARVLMFGLVSQVFLHSLLSSLRSNQLFEI